MFSARRVLAGLVVTAGLTGCGLEAGPSTGRADAGRSASVPTLQAKASPAATGSSLSDGARLPAHVGVDLHVDRSQLSAAREDARAFFRSYVAYLYGQLSVRRVTDLSPSLREQLDSDRAEATPAERSARARIIRLKVAIGHEPMTVVAVALVSARSSVSHLTATLAASGSGWRVAAVAG
jgi:hypothetical protein